MANKTDPRLEKQVCDLKKQGYTKAQIVKETGVKEGTVKEILRRNGLTKKDYPTPAGKDSRTPARELRTDSTLVSDPPAPTQPPVERGQIDPNLTQANASREIIQYVQFFRSRTKRIPYDGLSPHDTVWAEGMYGKRWESGISLMINTTGLSPESLQQALDDYEIDVADALERFNSRYRKEEQDAGD